MSDSFSQNTTVEYRVAILESELEVLTRNVDKLSDLMMQQNKSFSESVATLVKDINKSLKELSNEVSDLRRTDWSTLIAGATLACIILGAILFPIWSSIDELKRDLKSLEEINNVKNN